jgi:hypothetical protein
MTHIPNGHIALVFVSSKYTNIVQRFDMTRAALRTQVRALSRSFARSSGLDRVDQATVDPFA